MKVIDKLISFVFDVAIIIIATVILLVNFNVVQYEVLDGLFAEYLFNPEYGTIVNSICVVILLLALKVTVFTSSLSKTTKKNIMVDTAHGKIQIAQATIEGIAKNVIKDYPQIKDVQAAMTKAKGSINLYMSIVVYQGINIKDIITRVQYDVKSQIENTTSVHVNRIDVKIKNVIKIEKAIMEREAKIQKESVAEIEKSNDLTEIRRNEKTTADENTQTSTAEKVEVYVDDTKQ